MKKTMTTGESAGLALLTVTGAFGLWSATNSSIFAVKNWAKDDESKKNARAGMNAGLVAIAGLSAGSYLLSKKPLIAITTMLTGLGLYGYYEHLLRSNITKPQITQI